MDRKAVCNELYKNICIECLCGVCGNESVNKWLEACTQEVDQI